MFGGMVSSPLCSSQDSSDGRAVNDSPTSLLAHLLQLIFHAAPNTTKVYARHPVKIFPRLVGSFCQFILHPGIIKGGIQVAKGGHWWLLHNSQVLSDSYSFS
jgi:hypothetical protein